jgi:predicted chitinase
MFLKKVVVNDDTQRENFKGITSEQLVQAMKFHGLSKERANELLPYLNQAMYDYKIDTPMKQAMFLAQAEIESFGLTGNFIEKPSKKREIPTHLIYGRGVIQITFKDTYE